MNLPQPTEPIRTGPPTGGPGDSAAVDPRTGGLFLEFLRLASNARRQGPASPLRDWVELAEAWRIAQALRECRGNRSAAARSLGIGRRTLYSKMEKLGITETWALPGLDLQS